MSQNAFRGIAMGISLLATPGVAKAEKFSPLALSVHLWPI